MMISVFGLGYVGCVNIGCLSELGHKLVGVDIDSKKVSRLNNKKPTVSEPKLDFLYSKNADSFYATHDVEDAIRNSDIALLCINTPNDKEGNLNITILEKCIREISTFLHLKNNFFQIIIKSTVPPGTCSYLSKIVSNISSKVVDKHFSVVSIPEFLREGNAVEDFFNPPYTLVGTELPASKSIISELCGGINGEIIFTDGRTAEFMKFVNNSFHALKVAFANEIGVLSKALKIDSVKLMKFFCIDQKLNISPYYLKPGFAYGGSCLPKDLLATNTLAKNNKIELPLLSNVSVSNDLLIESLSKFLFDNYKNVGVVGIAFKPDTDDVRNSPIIKVISNLLEKDINVNIYEKFIINQLNGANSHFLEEKIPNIRELMIESVNELVDKNEVIILFTENDSVKDLIANYPDKFFLDLTTKRLDKIQAGNYEGYTW